MKPTNRNKNLEGRGSTGPKYQGLAELVPPGFGCGSAALV
jgi:hypothetical protein